MVMLTLMLVFVGGLLGGKTGMTFALVMAFGMNFVTYWFSDKIVLKMYRAKPVTETEAPELYSIVRRLAQRAGLPMPKVCIMEQDQPNAFATGRNPEHGVVAVTTGIMRVLSREELEGVIAHELAHIRNRDILVGTVQLRYPANKLPCTDGAVNDIRRKKGRRRRRKPYGAGRDDRRPYCRGQMAVSQSR
jgi:heat shock protein HtpX